MSFFFCTPIWSVSCWFKSTENIRLKQQEHVPKRDVASGFLVCHHHVCLRAKKSSLCVFCGPKTRKHRRAVTSWGVLCGCERGTVGASVALSIHRAPGSYACWHRWPFGKIDGPGKCVSPSKPGPSLSFKQTNQKGHLCLLVAVERKPKDTENMLGGPADPFQGALWLHGSKMETKIDVCAFL